MAIAAGLIVRLNPDRMSILEDGWYDEFAEPVIDFEHSRNLPLICFIVDNSDCITHISLGRKGNRAGTGLRRLNLQEIFLLHNKLPISSVCNKAPNTVKKKIQEKNG